MIVPVETVSFFDSAKVELGIGVEVRFGEPLEYFALGLQTGTGDIHKFVEPPKKILLVIGKQANAGHVNGDDSYRTGKWVGSKEPSAAALESAEVEAQPATHGSGVIGRHIGVHKVGEIGNAVTGGRFPQTFQTGLSQSNSG